MNNSTLEHRIKERGRDFFASIAGEKPTLFKKSWWTGKVMDWAMHQEHFRTQLFRFIDVLPTLSTEESLVRHLEEYFAGDEGDIPLIFKWGAGSKTGSATMLAKSIRANIKSMADQFIIGNESTAALKSLDKLRRDGFAFTMDILGEATLSEKEEILYQQSYLDLLEALDAAQPKWVGLGDEESESDWGHAPRINLSIKPTTLYSQADPKDFNTSLQALVKRFEPILARARAADAFICIDMEQHKFKDLTLALYRQLRSSAEFRDYPHLGVVLQSYLKKTDQDLDDLLQFARQEELPISIRLVKGAYWDYETVIARQNGWPVPVYTGKEETDAAYERHAGKILANHDICHFAGASHNIRSISAIMEMADELNVPPDRYEFQVLYGMAEPVRTGLLKVAKRVRLYCPFGEILPGMAYLVRRLLENTSNESFLRQSFAEGTTIEKLLDDPAALLITSHKTDKSEVEQGGTVRNHQEIPLFRNEPLADFSRSDSREAFPAAIVAVRKMLGRIHPLRIGRQEIITEATQKSVNPANPTEIIGHVCQADETAINLAIRKARKAFPGWRDTPWTKRADYLFRIADKMRKQVYQLAAWQILEVGKQWDQAYADIAEAIDFLEYYGREMLRLGTPQRLGRLPGELNLYFYQPRGVAAVIAPWNFPMAISCGMCAAALVTGNCVLYKPSGLSCVTGSLMSEIFLECDLPEGVFSFVPGQGDLIGDCLVDHPDISVIAFTGSQEIGLRVKEKASKVRPGQQNVKKVIAEMGGKNAIIIDDDADLDEAVRHVIHSAFAYQGQKCSACSRVIVLEAIYDKFVHRLVEAAGSLKIGPAEDPANFMGPVIDKAAKEKFLHYLEIAEEEGNILLSREIPEEGHYVPLTIVEGIRPEHRLANEEIFGPILSVMRTDSFADAVTMANSTPYALTGGVFSRSPSHLALASRNFRVGNLYLNRSITGALVGRQPFGGFRMSGIGSKAGGPDYLLQFMEPRTITENTMRRGFAPNLT